MGKITNIKRFRICKDHMKGLSINQLSNRYQLKEKSISEIISKSEYTKLTDFILANTPVHSELYYKVKYVLFINKIRTINDLKNCNVNDFVATYRFDREVATKILELKTSLGTFGL